MLAPSAPAVRPLAFLLKAPAVEPRLRQAFSHAALESLRVAMWAKLVAVGLVVVFLVAQFPSWAPG